MIKDRTNTPTSAMPKAKTAPMSAETIGTR